jgi:endonuclease/exonuclease/phosphatase (EEP) superfamily protein YafD
MSTVRKDLLSVTVIYLYTFPTLLVRLLPLLAQLFVVGQLRAVVTLTYHIHALPQVQEQSTNNRNQPIWNYVVERTNDEHDLCLYTHISLQSSSVPCNITVCSMNDDTRTL